MCNLIELIINKDMKKFIAIVFLGAFLSVLVASCSTSTAGHCDAYGNIHTTSKSDLASK